MLLSSAESKTKLKLQVLFKGQDKHTIKFEYNRDTDTAEDVVQEMVRPPVAWPLTLQIDEKVLAAKYQGLVCHEIHRILRDLSKTTPGERLASPLDAIRLDERPSASASASSSSSCSNAASNASTSHRRAPSELDGVYIPKSQLCLSQSVGTEQEGETSGGRPTTGRRP